MGKKGARDSLGTLKQITWKRSINMGLRFSVAPKRFLPFLFSDIAALLVILVITLNNAELMEMLYSGAAIPPDALPALFWSVLVFGAWMVVSIWVTGAVIHQTRKPGEYRKSWQVACGKLHTLLLALIVVSVLSFAVSAIPYAGALLSFVVSIAFVFINHFIVLDGAGLFGSLSGSLKTLRGKVAAVFVTWSLSVIFTTLIISVFTIPLLTTFLVFGDYGDEDFITSLLLYPEAPWLYISGFVLMVGVAISKVFALKYLTEVYLQFRKKKWLLS